MRPTCWENAMARIKRIGIRITEAEHQQLREAATRLEFRGPSALVRQAIRNELARRNIAAKDAEEQVAASSDRQTRARWDAFTVSEMQALDECFLEFRTMPRLLPRQSEAETRSRILKVRRKAPSEVSPRCMARDSLAILR